MSESKDYYDILGVPRGASDADIRKAYRTLAAKLHPDINKEHNAADRFARIQDAYDVLSDSEKRGAYDRFSTSGVRGGGPTGQWQASGPGFDPADFASIFEQFMGGGHAPDFTGRGGPSVHRPPRTRKGNREASLHTSFLTAALGGTESLRLKVGDQSETVTVQVPPGTETGSKLRLKGKGHPGDLILSLTVGAHPFFRRDGLDIIVDVPLTISEAVLGTTVTVPLLRGSVDLRIPPGTSSGRRLRVKGKGIETPDRSGDFFAAIGVVVPGADGLSEDQKTLLRTLSESDQNPRDSLGWSDRL